MASGRAKLESIPRSAVYTNSIYNQYILPVISKGPSATHPWHSSDSSQVGFKVSKDGRCQMLHVVFLLILPSPLQPLNVLVSVFALHFALCAIESLYSLGKVAMVEQTILEAAFN